MGNLPPKKEVTLSITYVTELTHIRETNSVRFGLPLTAFPRYSPNPSTDDHLMSMETSSASELTYSFNVMGEIEMPYNIKDVKFSHPCTANISKRNAKFELSKKFQMPLASDYFIEIQLERPHEPRAWLEVDSSISNKTGKLPIQQLPCAAMLCFYPNLDSHSVATEIIFVVDRY